jgi:hypothetical protein
MLVSGKLPMICGTLIQAEKQFVGLAYMMMAHNRNITGRNSTPNHVQLPGLSWKDSAPVYQKSTQDYYHHNSNRDYEGRARNMLAGHRHIMGEGFGIPNPTLSGGLTDGRVSEEIFNIELQVRMRSLTYLLFGLTFVFTFSHYPKQLRDGLANETFKKQPRNTINDHGQATRWGLEVADGGGHVLETDQPVLLAETKTLKEQFHAQLQMRINPFLATFLTKWIICLTFSLALLVAIAGNGVI